MKSLYTEFQEAQAQRGDIISIDIGAKYNGYHGDSAWTYPVGNISESVQKLLDVTEKSLYLGLEQVKPGEIIKYLTCGSNPC